MSRVFGEGAPLPPPTLFMVVLGGRLARAHIELHDVRFVVGATIDDTLPELRPEPFPGPERLWFVNLGGYDPAQLAEQHAFGLFVASSPQAAKAAARRCLLPHALERHKDDLHGVEAALEVAVDDCLPLEAVAGAGRGVWWLHLLADGGEQPQIPDWFGYRLI